MFIIITVDCCFTEYLEKVDETKRMMMQKP